MTRGFERPLVGACARVLTLPMQVTVFENPITGRPMMYPDTTREYPRVTVNANCNPGPCSTILGQIFSYLQVRSERGLPSNECASSTVGGGVTNTTGPTSCFTFPYLTVKFGATRETPLRLINENCLLEGCVHIADKRMPASAPCDQQINRICVIADPNQAYAINWGWSWASNGSNRPFELCASTTNAIDNCTTPVVIVVPQFKKRDASAANGPTQELLDAAATFEARKH